MRTIKKIIFTTLTCAFFMGFLTDLTAQKNTIQIRPFSTKVWYERMVSPNISVGATAKLFPIFFNGDNQEGALNFSMNTYSLAPEVRFYLTNNDGVPKGFYVAPYLKGGLTAIRTTVTSDENLRESAKFRGYTVGGGVVAGWQWVTDGGFTIGTGLGWSYRQFHLDDLTVEYSDGTKEVEEFNKARLGFGLPVFRFSLGYAF